MINAINDFFDEIKHLNKKYAISLLLLERLDEKLEILQKKESLPIELFQIHREIKEFLK